MQNTDARDRWLRGATAWLLERAGLAEFVAAYLAKQGEPALLDPGEFRGLSMVDLAREALGRAGVRTTGMLPLEIFGHPVTRSGDFRVLLDDTIRQVVLAAYAIASHSWSCFCRAGSVPDTRPHERRRYEPFTLEPLAEGSQFSRLVPGEEAAESIRAERVPKVPDEATIAISRESLINNDVRESLGCAWECGLAAGRRIDSAVYALLAQNGGLGPTMKDGRPLFDAVHGNITAGAPLDADALDADRVAMTRQVGGAARSPELRPAILVVPLKLGGEARGLGMPERVIDPPHLTGTRRYLFADPVIAPAIEVTFLDGQQQPRVESIDQGTSDSFRWSIAHYYGVAAIDWRAAVTNEGAAC